jgi:DNA-binding response OmpR family regulator
MATRILLVDDEKLIVKGVKFSLEQDGMVVVTSHDGEEALNIAKKETFDLIILDIMLPKLDGLEICQAIREFSTTPIIMLTAKSEDMDKIMGLEYGADDYITKPFNILELKARIKAILRRAKQKPLQAHASPPGNIFVLRDMRVDRSNRRVSMNGKEVNLTAKEFDLLELFVENPDKIYTREELLSTVWGHDYPGDVRTVDVHVRRLREKIEAIPGEPKYIHTKWGVGYFYK